MITLREALAGLARRSRELVRCGRPERGGAGRQRGFWRDSRAAAAVEFGLLGTTFTVLFCFWIELGLTLFMQTALDNATRDASRKLRTGVVTSATGFASTLCGDLNALMTCSSIKYNVVSGSSFAGLSTAVTTDSSNQMSGTQFSPGGSGADVVVQVGYTRSIFLPIVDRFLGSNGTVLLVSTLAFQNEPY
jgi:Flp pilus assembly protein TadG